MVCNYFLPLSTFIEYPVIILWIQIFLLHLIDTDKSPYANNMFMKFDNEDDAFGLIMRSVHCSEKHDCKKQCESNCIENACFGILVNHTNKLDDSCYTCNAADKDQQVNSTEVNATENVSFYLLMRKQIDTNVYLKFDR